jgi:hypothetical protein
MSLVAALPGVTTLTLVSRRRNGTKVALRVYTRLDGSPNDVCVGYFHGMCGSAENFIFQLRAETRPFFAFDMLGCGASAYPQNAHAHTVSALETYFAPAQLADDAENVWRFATRGARPCVLVAHSYSTSLVTQWLARLERTRARVSGAAPAVAQRFGVRGVVLIGTAASQPPIAERRAVAAARAMPMLARYAAVTLVSGPLRAAWRTLGGGASTALGTLGARGASRREGAALWHKWEREKTALQYAASVCTCEWASEQDFGEAYARTPLAVSWGAADTLTPVDTRFWASAAPALCAVKVCAGYAHWPMLENAEFDAWLRTVVDAFAHNAPFYDVPPLPPTFVGAEFDERRVCAECGGAAAQRCAACATAYCGAACQKLSWQRGHACSTK